MTIRFSLVSAIFLLLCFVAQAKSRMDTVRYPAVVQFQSHCCGVPDDAPLRSFIKSYKKQNRIKKIIAYNIGPMGKEGEYYLAFPLKELSKKQKISFIKKISAVTQTLNDKGSASLVENMVIEETSLPSRATRVKQLL